MDTLNGMDGDDEIYSRDEDGVVDTIDCGAGNDTAFIRAEDVAAPNCENVVIVTD